MDPPSGKIEGGGPQFHLTITPLDVEIKGKTGMMHEWIGIPETATDTSVPQGSVVDRYIEAIEDVHREAKTKKTVQEVFNLMKGNSYLFVKKQLGKAFQGKQAADHWVPKKQVDPKTIEMKKKQ